MSYYHARQRKETDAQPTLTTGQDPKPRIPCLPPAPESMTEKQWRPDQQSQSKFFQLPAELRDLILREAFGDRTIHIDLRPRHVEDPSGIVQAVVTCVPRETAAQMWRRRARRLVPWLGPKPRNISDAHDSKDESRPWGWYSCFCHLGQFKPLGEIVNGQIGVDCLFGDGCRGRWEPDEPDQLPGEARIGATGFLLSCKRASDDGLHALYATNTFSIESQSLFLCLLRQDVVPGAPRLTGPGTQLITSLRVSSSLSLWIWGRSAENARRSQDCALFAEQLDLLPRAFPHLRRLDWMFSRYMYHTMEPVPLEQLGEIEELLLGPLLRASAGMPSLKEFVVRVPDTSFVNVMTLEQHRPEPRQNFVGQRFGDIRMWYPFTGRPGLPGPDGGGFWVACGEDQNRERVYDGSGFGPGLW